MIQTGGLKGFDNARLFPDSWMHQEGVAPSSSRGYQNKPGVDAQMQVLKCILDVWSAFYVLTSRATPSALMLPLKFSFLHTSETAVYCNFCYPYLRTPF